MVAGRGYKYQYNNPKQMNVTIRLDIYLYWEDENHNRYDQ